MGRRVYHVYILASRSRNLYIGVTGDLKRRVLQHKQDLVEGFTRKYRIHRLVYFEAYMDVRDALGREKQIKAWRRGKKVAPITANNPLWDDLSREWYKSVTGEKQIPRSARDDKVMQ